MLLVFSPFYFQDFGSSLLSLLCILFEVDCLFPLHLFGLVHFYLVPSSAAYFSVFSVYLTYCVWGLLFTGCRFIVLVVFGVCSPVGKVASVGCVGFLVEGTGACVPVDEDRKSVV